MNTTIQPANDNSPPDPFPTPEQLAAVPPGSTLCLTCGTASATGDCGACGAVLLVVADETPSTPFCAACGEDVPPRPEPDRRLFTRDGAPVCCLRCLHALEPHLFCTHPPCSGYLHKRPDGSRHCGGSHQVNGAGAWPVPKTSTPMAREIAHELARVHCALRGCGAIVEVPAKATPERITRHLEAAGWSGTCCSKEHATALVRTGDRRPQTLARHSPAAGWHHVDALHTERT